LRLKALQVSLAVATAAFEGAKLEKFDIPVFNEKAQAENELDTKLAAIDAKLDKGKDGDDDEAAKAKAKADADKAKADADKAKADAAAKTKDGAGKDDDEAAKAKAKADADKEKADADKAKADKAKADAAKADDTDWPSDLAKSANRSDEMKELYDYGDDSPSA
jgi:colicin import membrane protein